MSWRVAVKEIASGPAQLTDVGEAHAAARLDHPGVAAFYDVIPRGDRSWIVMEYVKSRSLHEVVRADGPLPHSRTARIGLGILAALRAAHAAGVLHLDVKPHNVLLADDGRIVLTDFGLARIEGADHGREPLIGSPHFVAPERLRGRTAGPESDLFSLGATLHATVEGRPPFQRPTAQAALAALLDEPPDPPGRPGALTAIIAGLLAKEPATRPPADLVEAALRRAADHAVGIARVPGAPDRGTGRDTGGSSSSGSSGSSSSSSSGGGSTGTAAENGAARPPARNVRHEGIVSVPHRPARSTKISVAVAALLLAGTAGTALALDLDRSAPAPAAAAAASPPPECAPGGMPVGGRPQFRGYAVPAGWLWHEDPLGFAVAVPRGWTRASEGGTACFRDPDGSRTLGVDATARPAPDPRAVWTAAESRANLPGYRRTTLGERWDFTWQPPGDPVRRHERRLLVERPGGRAYLVAWATAESDWSAGEATLSLSLASLS